MSKRLTPALSAAITALGLLGPVVAFAAIPVAPATFDESLRIFTSTPRNGVNGASLALPESVPESFVSALGTAFSGVVTTTSAPIIKANLSQNGGDGNFVASTRSPTKAPPRARCRCSSSLRVPFLPRAAKGRPSSRSKCGLS
jgi:hypothetical protein